MICSNCGNRIEKDSMFCGHCGQQISQQSITETPQEKKQRPESKQIKISKEKMKTIIIVAAIVAIIVIIAGLIVGIAASKVNLKNYVVEEIAFSGANGYGSVSKESVSDFINDDALIDDTHKKVDEDDYYSESYWGNLTDDDFFTIMDYLEIVLPENNGALSNGDNVKITVKIDKNGIKENKNIIKSIAGGDEVSFEYKVSGLPECVAIDIFDAIEAYNYDTTVSRNNLQVKYKDDYKKTYDNGIEVRVVDGQFTVYGNDFYSFKMGVEPHTDNIHPDSESVELFVECEETAYLEYGLVFAPVSKQFAPNIITYITENSFSDGDILTLTNKANEAVSTSLGSSVQLESVKFYIDNNPDRSFSSMLVYYYKNNDVYNVVVYDDLKQIKGAVYDITNLEANIRGWFGYATEYSSIEDFEDDIYYTQVYELPIN